MNIILEKVSLFLHYINSNGLICIIILIMLFAFKRYKIALSGFLSLSITFIFVQALKVIVKRPRPYVELDITPLVYESPYSSFPSGHVSSLASISVVLWYNFPKLRKLLIIVNLLMMWSRVYLKMHHVTDVVIGLIIGLCVGFVVEKIIKLCLERRND